MLRGTREWRTRQHGIAPRSRVQRVARAGRVLLAIGLLSLAYSFAAIPMGLWISNRLPPFEGIATPLFAATSIVALIATAAGIVALAIREAVRPRTRRDNPVRLPGRAGATD
jgi:hypothetical protein